MWWNISSVPASVAIGSQLVFDLTPLAALPAGLEGGFTCKRMIITARLRQAAFDATSLGAFGVLVATRVASLDLPDAIVDLVDWYLQQGWDAFRESDDPVVKEFNYDIKTARKVRGEDRTLWFVTNNSAASAAAIVASATVRMWLQRS